MLREEIMDRTFQDSSDGIEMGDIIMSKGLFTFHLADKVIRKVKLKGKDSLRKSFFHTKLFAVMNNIQVRGRYFFDGLLGRPGSRFCRLFHT